MMFRPFLSLRVVSVIAAFMSGALDAQTITSVSTSISGLSTGLGGGFASGNPLLSPMALVQAEPFRSTLVIGEVPL